MPLSDAGVMCGGHEMLRWAPSGCSTESTTSSATPFGPSAEIVLCGTQTGQSRQRTVEANAATIVHRDAEAPEHAWTCPVPTCQPARAAKTAAKSGTILTGYDRRPGYAGSQMPELAGRVADAFEARIRATEERTLSPLAVRSYETRGRLRHEDDCRIRTPFQRDRDRIVHSKPFRRLKGKTQVFIDPTGDHYRTRMTHTLETTGIARVVARALRLNEDLVEAIGLGHDMGHTPFGHAGEEALDAALADRFGGRFRHNEQSLRIAERLNLTEEVREGILTHTGEREPASFEGKIVRIVDRVAYINHDIDDAIRHGILRESDLPRDELDVLGETGSARIDTLVHDLIETSEREGDIAQSDEIGGAMLSLRAFMFDNVYLGPHTHAEHEHARATVRRIFDALADRGDGPDEITEFVAGMTDRYALEYAAAL